MLWRVLTAFILLFWAVMTGLLLRDTYFPDPSHFTEVPPQRVFDLFLAETSAFNNTLHLYKNNERLGHATFSARRLGDDPQAPAYALVSTGTVQLSHLPSLPDGTRPEVSFHFRGQIKNADPWQSLELELRIPTSDIHARIHWREGIKLPEVEVKRGAETLMNTEALHTMLAFGGIPGFAEKLPALQSSGHSTTSALKAREGILELAGKRRKCHILTAELLGAHQVRAFFTEAGALARVELPEGYTLLEPLMHGQSLLAP